MLKRFLIVSLACIAIIFSLFTLSVKVDAKPSVLTRSIFYRDVCCGTPCAYDFCFDKGNRICCILAY
jgi:hypothetical protein